MPKIVILTEGKSNPSDAKTACGLLRYRPADVVALLDSENAGKSASSVLGVGGDVPFVSSLAGLDADTLVIGIAPAGGALPPEWRDVVRQAIRAKMNVVSGLHTFLRDDPEFAALAHESGAELVDVRSPADDIPVAQDRVRHSACHRVHTVGHDCNVGKMVVACEIDTALRQKGYRSQFLATGQTGMMISGLGVPADHIVSDFVSGAVEQLVLEHEDNDFVIVEGQGSIIHPLYSGVTLSLLHGCAPQSMVLVFEPGRTLVRSTRLPLPSLTELRQLYETLASYLTPSQVVAVAANTAALSADAAERCLREAENELSLPAADVIRDGPDRIVEAILNRHRELTSNSEAGKP